MDAPTTGSRPCAAEAMRAVVTAISAWTSGGIGKHGTSVQGASCVPRFATVQAMGYVEKTARTLCRKSFMADGRRLAVVSLVDIRGTTLHSRSRIGPSPGEILFK